MKINILSPGRFHVLDLARELDKNGLDVKFYSFVPTKRAMQFGLPRHCSVSLFYVIAPFLALSKVFKGAQWTTQLRIWVQDRLTAFIMRKCDIVIAMSGDFIYSPIKAKKQGAIVIIERGSKHILEQKRILESIPSLKGTKPVPDANVKRELKCYEIADYISVASLHVKRSFLQHNYPENKIFVNPYGVDLSMFYPSNKEKKYDIIMVGAWSYQKGADLVLDAIRQLKLQFLHVGTLVDVPFVEDEYCHHHDAVNQKELVDYYNQAKVFILPSRQEGLAMVQAQAIACNLSIIGSPDSGAEDLKDIIKGSQYVSLIEDYSIDALKNAISKALKQYESINREKCYADNAIDDLSWDAYGKRYAQIIRQWGGGRYNNGRRLVLSKRLRPHY